MNCRPGDLAVIVNGRRRVNNGRIVKVLRRYVEGEILPGHFTRYRDSDEITWVVRSEGGPLLTSYSGEQILVAARDRVLRPIRPEAGDDETLAWAGLPHKQGEPA